MEQTTWIIMAIMHMQIKESTIESSTAGNIWNDKWNINKTKRKKNTNDFYNAFYVNQINTLLTLSMYGFSFQFLFNFFFFSKKKSSCFCSVLNLPFFAGFQWSAQWNIIHVVNEQRTEKTMTWTHRRLCGFTLQLFLLAKLSKNNKKKKENN